MRRVQEKVPHGEECAAAQRDEGAMPDEKILTPEEVAQANESLFKWRGVTQFYPGTGQKWQRMLKWDRCGAPANEFTKLAKEQTAVTNKLLTAVYSEGLTLSPLGPLWDNTSCCGLGELVNIGYKHSDKHYTELMGQVSISHSCVFATLNSVQIRDGWEKKLLERGFKVVEKFYNRNSSLNVTVYVKSLVKPREDGER